MSIESDIVTALSGVQMYPVGEIPEDAMPPLVAYRRTLRETVNAMEGPYGLVHSEFTFECWGEKTDSVSAKAASLTLAAQVRSQMEASATLKANYRFEIPTPGDLYEAEVLEIMEPVSYSFHHT